MGSTKEREALTEEEKELAAEAFEHARCVAKAYEKRFSKHKVDWLSEIGIRICGLISRYDEKTGVPLRKWAILQAHYACRDIWRSHWYRTRSGKSKVRFVSLDESLGFDNKERPDHKKSKLEDRLFDRPVLAPHEISDAYHLLRGLTAIERDIVWGSIVEGKLLVELGKDHGIAENTVSLYRSNALKLLKEWRHDEVKDPDKKFTNRGYRYKEDDKKNFKLTLEDAANIKQYLKKAHSLRETAKLFNVSFKTVWCIDKDYSYHYVKTPKDSSEITRAARDAVPKARLSGNPRLGKRDQKKIATMKKLGKTAQEIAADMGISEGRVWQILREVKWAQQTTG